jgi:transcriptional regulator with GAF, ATPase, and Fis domain
MTPVDRADVLGDATDRLQVISGALLDTELDDQLQAIAAEVTQRLRMPVAMVALLLRRMQFYRAYVGLPHEVEILRSTDRCVGLCQHVLRAGAIVVFEDTRQAAVPQLLVDRYGVRSYIGAPVQVAGQLVGTLCCVDFEPRRFSDEDRAAISELAERVSHRLSELAETSAPPATSTPPDERSLRMRADTDRLVNQIALARVSALELSPAMRILEQALAENPGRYAAWVDLPRAHADLEQTLSELERIARHLRQDAGSKAATPPPLSSLQAAGDEKNRQAPG